MSLVPITRLKPNKLQLIQLLTTSATSLLTDVIKGMQATYANNLNTPCPTCVKNGNPTGFLQTTVSNKTINFPCTTCNGYMLYHTAGGALTPPTNPFGSPIAVAGVLPADINESILGFPSATQLDTLITALQGNVTYPITNDCPTCVVSAKSTGNVTIRGAVTTCPTCVGMQKTVRPYELVNGKPVLSPIIQPPPDPLPTPPNPFGDT